MFTSVNYTDRMKKTKNSYHHGDLAESLLTAVDEIATKFGLEAVTLRACAKLVGVSPSAAFRHYADKKSLLTAFATRALQQLAGSMEKASVAATEASTNPFHAVGLAYVEFALDKPAFFRAMWREESLYTNDEQYIAAANQLRAHLESGFANTLDDKDPDSLSAEELLAWSAVHGMAKLFVEGTVAKQDSKRQKLARASAMLSIMDPALFDRR